MTRAQAAWAALTGLFLIASVVLLTVRPDEVRFTAGLCLWVAITGWALLTFMIFNDRRPPQ